MKREFLKDLGLEEETIDQIIKEHGKTVNSIKEKADSVETLESQIEDYKQQIKDRDKQLQDLSEQAEGNEELQKKIRELEEENKAKDQEFEQKLAAEKKEAKLELALEKAKAKNTTAVKSLLNLESISLDGDNLIGLEEQLNTLQEKETYLFGEDEPAGLKGRQPHPGDGGKKTGITKEQFEQMSYKERVDLYNNDIETYKKLSEGE